jgi:small conductance mechanosensitive channel
VSNFLTSGDPLTQILLNILEALVIVLVALVLARFAKGWTVRLLTRSRVNLSVATLVGNLAQVGVVLIGIITALPVIGIQWASLVAVLSIAGLAISLSVQDLLKNVVAGIYILMEQPFRIGDRISVKEVTGVVLGIELRTTILRTDDHLQVVVPNNTVLNEIITNRSTNNLVRATVLMRIKRAANTDLNTQVRDTVASIPDVASTPAPVVTPEGIFEGTARIKIEFWVPTGKKAEVTAAVVEALQTSFPDANLKVVP